MTVGGTPATDLSISPTQISCTAPAKADHTAYDVVVTNPDGLSSTMIVAVYYGYHAPTVTSITPNSGLGDVAVTIGGTHFRPGATVKFNLWVPAQDEVVVDANTITCTTPSSGFGGPSYVNVYNDDQQTGQLNPAYDFTTPLVDATHEQLVHDQSLPLYQDATDVVIVAQEMVLNTHPKGPWSIWFSGTGSPATTIKCALEFRIDDHGKPDLSSDTYVYEGGPVIANFQSTLWRLMPGYNVAGAFVVSDSGDPYLSEFFGYEGRTVWLTLRATYGIQASAGAHYNVGYTMSQWNGKRFYTKTANGVQNTYTDRALAFHIVTAF